MNTQQARIDALLDRAADEYRATEGTLAIDTFIRLEREGVEPLAAVRQHLNQ